MGRFHHDAARRLCWLPLLAGASAWPACSRAPSVIEPHSAAAPQTRASSKTARGATTAPVAACPHGIDVRLLDWDEPATADFDAVRTLTSARGEMLDRIWYASPGSDEVHAMQRSATVAQPSELSLPPQLRFTTELKTAEDGERVGIVATTWTAAEKSELAFTVLGADGRFSQPLRVDPSALSDDQPQIAAGGPGTFALVWRRGVSAPPYQPPALCHAIKRVRRTAAMPTLRT